MRQYSRNNTKQLQTWVKVPQEPCSVLAARDANLAELIGFETLRAPGVSLRDAVDGRCPSEWQLTRNRSNFPRRFLEILYSVIWR